MNESDFEQAEMLRLGTQKTDCLKAEAKEMQTTELTVLNTSADQKGSDSKEKSSDTKEFKKEKQFNDINLLENSVSFQEEESSSNRLEGTSMTSSMKRMMTA